MNTDILFTVFTPTYNRKELLHRVYNCLKNQTFRGFEWVIIDDGSTDGTGELISQWQKEANFSIVYQWQPNQGKHIAFNAVAKIAKGELLTSIDSDDEIVPIALERLKFHWDNFTAKERETICGISFNSKDQFGKLVGTEFPKAYEIMDLMGMYFINNIKGDKGGMLQTKVLKQYPFPEHIKNVYVPEGSFMYQVAKDWKMCFINETLRIYWLEERPDSLSTFSTTVKNYAGSHYSNMCFLNYNMRFLFKRPKLVMGQAMHYARLSFHLHKSIKKQFASIKPFAAKLLWACFMPIGFVFFLKDKLNKK